MEAICCHETSVYLGTVMRGNPRQAHNVRWIYVVFASTPYFGRLESTLTSTPRSSKWSLSCKCSDSNLTHMSQILHTCLKSYTHVSNLPHMSQILHTCLKSYTHVSNLTHVSQILHTCLKSYTRVSNLTHMSQILHTCLKSYTHVSSPPRMLQRLCFSFPLLKSP